MTADERSQTMNREGRIPRWIPFRKYQPIPIVGDQETAQEQKTPTRQSQKRVVRGAPILKPSITKKGVSVDGTTNSTASQSQIPNDVLHLTLKNLSPQEKQKLVNLIHSLALSETQKRALQTSLKNTVQEKQRLESLVRHLEEKKNVLEDENANYSTRLGHFNSLLETRQAEMDLLQQNIKDLESAIAQLKELERKRKEELDSTVSPHIPRQEPQSKATEDPRIDAIKEELEKLNKTLPELIMKTSMPVTHLTDLGTDMSLISAPQTQRANVPSSTEKTTLTSISEITVPTETPSLLSSTQINADISTNNLEEILATLLEQVHDRKRNTQVSDKNGPNKGSSSLKARIKELLQLSQEAAGIDSDVATSIAEDRELSELLSSSTFRQKHHERKLSGLSKETRLYHQRQKSISRSQNPLRDPLVMNATRIDKPTMKMKTSPSTHHKDDVHSTCLTCGSMTAAREVAPTIAATAPHVSFAGYPCYAKDCINSLPATQHALPSTGQKHGKSKTKARSKQSSRGEKNSSKEQKVSASFANQSADKRQDITEDSGVLLALEESSPSLSATVPELQKHSKTVNTLIPMDSSFLFVKDTSMLVPLADLISSMGHDRDSSRIKKQRQGGKNLSIKSNLDDDALFEVISSLNGV